MRGSMTILMVVLATALVLGLYIFLLKPKLDKQVRELETEKARLEQEQTMLARMQTEIPEMKKKLPEWRTRLGLYRKAIPEQLEDDRFLAAIEEQITRHNVQLLRVDLTRGGKWLRDLDEKSKEQLKGIGIEVETAQKIEVAFYAVTLSGNYADVLSSLEELKRYGRLYSIEQVNAPAGGAAGAVLQSDDPTTVPLEVTGAIFFGIPQDFMNVDQLYIQYIRSLLAPLASGAHTDIRSTGADVLKGGGRPAARGAGSQNAGNAQAGGMNT